MSANVDLMKKLQNAFDDPRRKFVDLEDIILNESRSISGPDIFDSIQKLYDRFNEADEERKVDICADLLDLFYGIGQVDITKRALPLFIMGAFLHNHSFRALTEDPAVFSAVYAKDAAKVEDFLNRGGDVNLTSRGLSLLQVAIACNDPVVLRLILAKRPTLSFATMVALGMEEEVRAMLKTDPSLACSKSMLGWAIMGNQPQMVSLLMEHGADHDGTIKRDMLEAAKDGRGVLSQLFRDRGFSLNLDSTTQ